MGTFYNRVTTDGTTRVATDGTTRVIVGFELGADIGVYSITGASAALLRKQAGLSAAGVYTITGADAKFLRNRVLLGSVGSYSISGGAAAFLYDRVRGDAPGSYSITGSNAALLHNRVLGTLVAAIDGTATNNAGPGASSVSASLTTTVAGDEIVVYVATASTGSFKTITGVTSTSGLSFTRRGSAAVWTQLSNSDGLVYDMQLEAWRADAPGMLVAESITAAFSAVTGAGSGAAIVAFGIAGADTSSLFNGAETSGLVAAGAAGGPTYSTTGGGPTIAIMGGTPNPSQDDASSIASVSIAGWGALYAYFEVNYGDVTNATNLQSSDTNLNKWEYVADAINLKPSGLYVISGDPAKFVVNRRLNCAPGSYAINGDDATFATAEGLAVGTYTITGFPSASSQGRVLGAAAGSYAITGSAATFATAEPWAAGSYTISGADASFVYDRVLGADAGSYGLNGDAASFATTEGFGVGSYAITGAGAALVTGHLLLLAAGVYRISGRDAALFITAPGAFVLPEAVGDYTIDGEDPNLSVTRLLPVTAGTYTINGLGVDFIAPLQSGDSDHRGERGQSQGKMPPRDRIHHAELEFFRQRDMQARGVAAMVPPPAVAHRNLTTPQYPSSRPVIVPAVYKGRPK